MQNTDKLIPLSWISDLMNSHAAVDHVIKTIDGLPPHVNRNDAIAFALPEFTNLLEDRWDRENGYS